MTKLKVLSANVQTLILARLGLGIKVYTWASVHQLAKIRGVNVQIPWCGICCKAGQRVCTIPDKPPASPSLQDGFSHGH
jgi:hypothetical protein